MKETIEMFRENPREFIVDVLKMTIAFSAMVATWIILALAF